MRLALLLFSLSFFPMSVFSQQLEDLWGEIDSLEERGLYRSAIEKTEEALALARQANAQPALIKGLLLQSRFSASLEEDEVAAAIRVIREAEASESGVTKALLQSILAQWYTFYVQSNYYRLTNRTELDDPDPEDFTTWSIDEFGKESNRLYLSSVKQEGIKEAKLEDWALVLQDEVNAPSLRTSVYDLLMSRAINHFRDSRSWLSESASGFKIDQREAFAAARDFAKYPLVDPEESSPIAKSLKLFQEWLGYLSLDSNKIDAFIDADLARLDFVEANAWVPYKEGEYRGALIRLIGEHPQHPASSEAWYRMATLLKKKGDRYASEKVPEFKTAYEEAVRMCRRAIRDYRGSFGAKQCRALIATIEQKDLGLDIETVYLPGEPMLVNIGYRNVERVWVRLVPMSQAQITEFRTLPYWDRGRWLSQQASGWEMAYGLKGMEDYHAHQTEIAVPAQTAGRYALITSDNKGFSSEGGALAYSLFNISEIGYLEYDTRQGNPSLIVVNRRTGAPMAGVTMELFSSNGGQEREEQVGSFVSDANGLITASVQFRKAYRFVLKKGDDQLDPNVYMYRYSPRSVTAAGRRVVFFTDRSIYRPGQVVYFKGILLETDAKGIPRIVANTKTTMQFLDANRQEVQSLDLQTNMYGTFEGSLTIPSSGLLGSMLLRARVGGSMDIRVEEYKRPRFEVLMDSLTQAYALGDKVKVGGKALGFAGNTIDGANVRIRVTRSVIYPWARWFGGYFPSNQPATQVAIGQTRTDKEGAFEFTFEAAPNYDIRPESQPAYHFLVEAEVIDISGEAHTSTKSIFLSNKRIIPGINGPGKLDTGTNLSLTVNIRDLNGNLASADAYLELTALEGPGRQLVNRYWDAPDQPLLSPEEFRQKFPHYPYANEDDPSSWTAGELIVDQDYQLNGNESILLPTTSLSVGYYRVSLKVFEQDKKDSTLLTHHFFVYDQKKGRLPAELSSQLEFTGLGPAQPNDVIGVEVISKEAFQPVWTELVQSENIRRNQWLDKNRTNWTYQLSEEDRGDLYLQAHWVYRNRYFKNIKRIPVAWSNKELKITYETFRDKLKPGAEEEWKIKISGPDSEPLQAEVLAAMYDQSLDQFEPHDWYNVLYPSYGLNRTWSGQLFGARTSSLDAQNWQPRANYPIRQYPSLKGLSLPAYRNREPLAYSSAAPVPADAGALLEEESVGTESDLRRKGEEEPPAPPPPPAEDESTGGASGFEVRRDLRETAFFFPQLETDKQGALSLKFTMGESLTRWKFMLMAHTRDLETAYATRDVVTQKDLMVLPNAPRFFREGDEVTFTAKVVNLSDTTLSGELFLELENPVTAESLDGLFGHSGTSSSFFLKPGESSVASWTLTVPAANLSAVLYRVKGAAGTFSDGEQTVLPVLTNQVLVTETLPLDIPGGESVSKEWEALQKALGSSTASPKMLTLEVTSNPAWLAVKSLPYLMDYPYECTEQLFNRLFANALASHLANSDPTIRTVFESWRRNDQLKSPLTMNEDLKNVLLSESPWVRDAQSEEDQQKRIALLFDLNRMVMEQADVLGKLQERQLPDGSFPWFPSGPSNWYITQYVLEGMGRLDRLGILKLKGDPEQSALVDNMVQYVDNRILEWYSRLEERVDKGEAKWEDDHLGSIMIHWIFTRSETLVYPMNNDLKKVRNYLLDQIAKYWTDKELQLQTMAAMAAHRFGKLDISAMAIASLKERAIRSESGGISWKQDAGWFWHQQSLETQSLIMEFFSETNQPTAWVEGMKTWVLKNKQTNRWETTKATASAILGLLSGSDGAAKLASTEPIEVTFPNLKKSDYRDKLDAATQQAEAGVGYYKSTWSGQEVTEDFVRVKMKNPNTGLGWAALYWQYMEASDKVNASSTGPLSLERELMVERVDDRGRILEKVNPNTILRVGDKVVLRIKVTASQEMEFVHLQMQRAAGMEPVITESGYHYQAGLAYYENIGDAANHFFFDYLPKGTHILEYPLRLSHAGSFAMGIGQIQSMYAPAFAGHTKGLKVDVQ